MIVRWLELVNAACFPCSVANLKAAQVWFLAVASELSQERLSKLAPGLAVDERGRN